MSKAILVMDMPDNCIGCPISTCYSCHVHGNQSHPRIGRPEWCPLRELPERKPERILKTLGKTVKTTRFEYSDLNIGWNACIDVIEGSRINENT